MDEWISLFKSYGLWESPPMQHPLPLNTLRLGALFFPNFIFALDFQRAGRESNSDGTTMATVYEANFASLLVLAAVTAAQEVIPEVNKFYGSEDFIEEQISKGLPFIVRSAHLELLKEGDLSKWNKTSILESCGVKDFQAKYLDLNAVEASSPERASWGGLKVKGSDTLKCMY